MCICLNCYRINNCSIYTSVAQKHKERVIFTKKIFYPQSPIIFGLNKFSKIKSFLIEWDVNECLSYQEEPGNWLFFSSPKLLVSNTFSSYLVYDLIF